MNVDEDKLIICTYLSGMFLACVYTFVSTAANGYGFVGCLVSTVAAAFAAFAALSFVLLVVVGAARHCRELLTLIALCAVLYLLYLLIQYLAAN